MRAHECRACGWRGDDGAWQALAVVDLLGPDQLRDLVTEWPWPRTSVLEVRRCRCGEPLTEVKSGA